MAASTGRCLCGAVRYTVDSVETEHHACHCAMCRRWASAPLFAAAATGVRWQGEENVARFASSEWAERGFCRRCGAHLFYYLKPAGQYLMCVGSFDDPAPFRLAREIYVDHKPAGYAFAGERPKLTEAEVIAQFTQPDAK